MRVGRAIVFAVGLPLLAGCAHPEQTAAKVSGYPVVAVVPRTCPPETCQRCDLSEVAHRFAGRGIEDCGWSKDSNDAEQLVRCGLSKAASGKPFLAIQSLPGIDSSVAAAYYRGTDGVLRKLGDDSDGSGANCPCSATIVLQVCRSGLRRNPEEPEWLDCDVGDPLDDERVCSERAQG